MGVFDDLIPSPETAKGAFDDLIPPPIKTVGAFDDLIPSHGATRSFAVTGKPDEPSPSFIGDVVLPTVNDLSGVITKAGAGLLHGGTLGIVNPEQGTVGIPFTDVKFKYAPPLAESLESLGMTPELAENPYIGIGPSMIGIGKPWGEISSFLTKAIMARRAGQTAKSLITGAEALPKPLSVIERIGLQTGIGGGIGAAIPREKDESIIENTLNTAALGGGLQALGEGVAAIAKATGIGKANAYQNLKQELSDIFYERAFSEKLGRTLSRSEADFAAGQTIDKGLASAGIEKPSWKDLWSAWRRVKGRRGMPPPKTEPPPAGEPATGPIPPGPEPQAPMPPSGIGSLEQILAQGTGKSPIIPPVRPIPGLKPGAPIIPEPDYAAEATQAGVVFNGLQETGEGKRPLPLFTDPVTKSTFVLPEGETISNALAKVRKKFQKKVEILQGTPPISTAAIPPAGELPPETGLPPSEGEIVQPGAKVGAKPIEPESVYRGIRKNEGLEAEILARGLNQNGVITIDTHVRGDNIVMQIHADEATLGRLTDTGIAVDRVPSKPGIDESYKIRVPKDQVERVIQEISVQHGATAGGKEPWMMTREEYKASPAGKQIADFNKTTQMYPGRKRASAALRYHTWQMQEQAHIADIKKALSEGKPVPPEVLADYPELAKRAIIPPVTKKPGTGEISAEKFPIKPASGEFVYHNTKGEFLDAIRAEGMNAGAFSDKPIDFGGDTWIAVRKSDLPKYQEHSYGEAISFEPGYETGLDAEGFPVLQAISADKIYVADKTGKLTAKLKPQTGPKAVGGGIYYSGTSRGIPIGKYTYLTKNAEYAKNFGEDVRQFSASPEKTLDITTQGEKSVSFESLQKTLKKEGVEVTEGMREKYDDVHKPIWQWIRKYPDMAEAIKSAGYDSIKQIETFTGKGKKESTLVILDQAKVNLLPKPSRPPEVGGPVAPVTKPIPVRTSRAKIPPTSEQIAKKKALMSIPVNQAVDFIIKNGYLNIENVKALSKQDAIRLNRRFFNRAPFGKIGSIARKDGKLGLDEVAAEFPQYFGTEQKNSDEHLLDILLDRGIVKSIEGKTDAELGAAEYEHYINKHGITGEDALDALSGEDQERIEGISLDEIAGEAGLSESEAAFAARDVEEFFGNVHKVKEGAPEEWAASNRDHRVVKEPRKYEPEVTKFERVSHESLGPEPYSAPFPENGEVIAAAVPDKPWEWTADDLLDLRPSERAAKLEKIWGPNREFNKWLDEGGSDKRRYWPLYDSAADLEYAIKGGYKSEVADILSDIQSRLLPQDYYAYEKVQNATREPVRPAPRTPAGEGEIPSPEGAGPPAVVKGEDISSVSQRKGGQGERSLSLPGLSPEETFGLVNPETQWGKLQPQDRGPRTGKLFLKSEETENQARLFEKGVADTGGYAERTRTEPPKPKTEAERNAYIANPRLYLELPEIVEFANRALEGKFPQVRRFMGMALGRFYPGSGKIKIINNMDLDTLAKVLAHEIGHLADWLPDKDMAMGNILGRIGSIPSYLKSLLEEYPGAPGKVLTEKDRERLRREAERQIKGDMTDEDIVTYITRTVPKYEEVGVTPEMILNLLKGLTNEPKNVLDFLKSIDGKVKAEIAKQAMKNLVDERLKLMMGRRIIGTETITEEVRRKRETEAERVSARYRELLREEIEKRRLYQREAISNELKDLTQKWKPFTPGEDSYTKYRLSSKELYADAVSVLFNDPELLRQTAPTFWKAFLNYFERKPELKAIYDELQARRANPDEVLEQRRRFTRGMAEEGAQIRARNAELLKSRNTLTPSKLWHAFRMAFGDQNIRAQELMEAARKAGRVVPDKDRIDYWVEELPYINSEVFGFRTGIEKDILAPAAEAGIGLVDLHEYMILKRAATERAGIYNPGGIGDRFADQQLDFMRRKLGDEKFGKVKELVERFQAEYRQQVTEVAAEADFLPADLVKTMRENPNYAAFANLEYLIEQHFGKGTSARIYKQYGMLGKVDNVFVQTVLKGMALIRAARHHQIKMAQIQSPDVGTVVRARRGHKGVGWQKPKDPDMGTIVVSPGGEPQAYYIDKELAQLWEHNEDKANAVTAVGMQGLRLIKGILSRIFIAWNPGWIVANPPRDFWATWKKVQEAHGSLAKGIAATFADAVQAGTGKFPERERRMLAERKILPGRFFNEPGSFDAMEREFLVDTNDPVVYQNKVLAPFLKAAHWLSENRNWFIVPRITQGLEVLGKIGERWGKFAADEAIRLQAEKKGLPIPEKRAAHLVRTRAGTPNSLSQGTLYWLTETFFPFSNVAAQDLRSSLEAFRESKGSYAFKTFLLNVLPKLVFAAMIAGYFGEDIKKTASKIGKYFRRMYINFPIAVLKDGNAVNITIPQDYTGQTVSALTDSVLSGDWSGSMGTLGILFENQPYNFNPFISSAADWVNYYALNQRPNDSFTGYPTMPQDVADVGGQRALAHMTRQTWNRFFGTMLYRVQADKVDQVENEMKTLLGAAPFNSIGRFIRITNTGDVERDMQTVSDVAKQEKEARLNLREAKVRDINARAGQATAKDIMTLYRQAIEAGDIDPIATSPSAFAKSYKEMALSREKNTFVQAMTRAATDREKAVLLLRWKAEMPDKEYEDLRGYLRANGLIGPGVGVQILLESQREKHPGAKSVPELLKKARGQ